MDWEEIASVAERIFRVWQSGEDLKWAEQAWKVLNAAGLVNGFTELERCKSVICLLCLGDYYYNFCTIYRDEFLETEFVDWASTFPIHGFQVGQLVGQTSLDDETDPDMFYQKGLDALVDLVSEEVIKTVEQSFGSRCSLFLSLWRSSLSSEENNLGSADYLTDKEILNNQLASGGFAAYVFGCSIEEIRNSIRPS